MIMMCSTPVLLSVPIRTAMKRSPVEDASTFPVDHLLSLCRNGRWKKMLERCETHPHEAIPIPVYFRPLKRQRSEYCAEEYNYPPARSSGSKIYEQTALGIVCSSTIPCKETKITLMSTLIRASPAQISAEQRAVGLTPLKELIQNPSCKVEELGFILDQDKESVAIRSLDLSGFSPLDHLIFRLNNDPSELNLRLLYCYMKKVEENATVPISCSPLIRLLSLSSPCTGDANQKNGQTSSNYIMECIEYLTKEKPSRLTDVSKTTGCTLLHIALRNFGDYKALIDFLLNASASNVLITTRNSFGDLPLHIACACGAPTDVLSQILRKTAEAFDMPAEGPHPLLWSTNYSGFSPFDLEWMRHTEGYGTVDNRQALYPLKVNDLRLKSSGEGMYSSLLKDTMEQAIKEKNYDCFVGELLKRIILIIRAAYGEKDTGEKFVLHAASLLSCGDGPCLPEPILLLLHSIYPAQARTLDSKGRLPLHYALMKFLGPSDQLTDEKVYVMTKYEKWIGLLISSYPEATKIADKNGRLPLHYALDNPCLPSELFQSLVHCNPASLESRDPISGLYPFQHAARANLNVSYRLLRQCPSLVAWSQHN